MDKYVYTIAYNGDSIQVRGGEHELTLTLDLRGQPIRFLTDEIAIEYEYDGDQLTAKKVTSHGTHYRTTVFI